MSSRPGHRRADASVRSTAGLMSVIGWIISGARDLPLGGPLGALIERAARCLPRRAQWRALWRAGAPRSADPRHSIGFTIAVIALGAKMAKADGTVTRDEVAAFREVFQVPPGEEAHLRLVARRHLEDLAEGGDLVARHGAV